MHKEPIADYDMRFAKDMEYFTKNIDELEPDRLMEEMLEHDETLAKSIAWRNSPEIVAIVELINREFDNTDWIFHDSNYDLRWYRNNHEGWFKTEPSIFAAITVNSYKDYSAKFFCAVDTKDSGVSFYKEEMESYIKNGGFKDRIETLVAEHLEKNFQSWLVHHREVQDKARKDFENVKNSLK